MAEFVWTAESPLLPAAVAPDPELFLSVLPRGNLWQILLPKGIGEFQQRCKQSLGISPAERRVVSNQQAGGAGISLIWSGMDQYFLQGPGESLRPVIERLEEVAHMLEQGDGRRVVTLEGPDAAMRQVLARLVPLDLRPDAFPAGSAAATELDHMPVHLWSAPETGQFSVAIFASFVESLCSRLVEAGFSARVR